MKYDNNLKQEIKRLRSCGCTYTEILRKLHIKIPKSTLSCMCKGIVMPQFYLNKIAKLNMHNFNNARALALISRRQEKYERRVLILKSFHERLHDKINDKDFLKTLLSFLYLGEGAKWKSHRGLMLGSADADIIRLYIRLLNLCYGVPTESLRCRVSFRADQNIDELQNYWSNVTSIPLNNFYKTIPDPRTVGRPTKRQDYKGVCVVTCAGTEIQLELEAIPNVVLKGL